jgi:AcrR family transcriptional regulator
MVKNKQLGHRRPSKAKREAQIIDAAFKVFAANGYEAARMDDVAKRAKIGKGTIFLHFQGKRALFRAVLCSLIQPVQFMPNADSQESPADSKGQLCELLSRIYVEIVENQKARVLLRLLIAESEKFPELAQIYHQEIIAPGASTIGLAIEKGIAVGEFGPSDVRRFPQILVAPAILAVVWMLLLGKRHPIDLRAYRQAHLDFVTRGLCGTAPRKAAPPAGPTRNGGTS